MSLNTTPRTWVSGEVVTAAIMNTEVRDSLTGIQAPWTSYVPAWSTTGTAPAIGNGTLTGNYLQVGKRVDVRIKIVCGSTTTFGTGTTRLALPVAPTGTPRLEVFCTDDSATQYFFGRTFALTGSVVSAAIHMAASNFLIAVTNTSPFTWATGDSLEVYGTYEAA